VDVAHLDGHDAGQQNRGPDDCSDVFSHIFILLNWLCRAGNSPARRDCFRLRDEHESLAGIALAFAGALPVGWLGHRWIERPLLARKRRAAAQAGNLAAQPAE
jgi:peptidoglycan/LPS O-acetylase OafA/YrhL